MKVGMKLLLAILIPVVVFCSVRDVSQVREFFFDVKVLFVSTFGTDAQSEELLEEIARVRAAQAGSTDYFETTELTSEVLRTMRELERRDPRWADAVLARLTEERYDRRPQDELIVTHEWRASAGDEQPDSTTSTR